MRGGKVPTPWAPRPGASAPSPKEVHLWRVDLARPAFPVSVLTALLSEDELKRAAAFHFDDDRRRYTVGRASLRLLAEQYTGVAAAALRFSYNSQGKPAIDGQPLDFNLSHTGDVAVYGFTVDAPIGVDVEATTDKPFDLQAGRSVFSIQEMALIESAPAELQFIEFLRCWTRKEAYVKATGQGIEDDLPALTITAARPSQSAPSLESNWTICEFEVDESVIGAIASPSEVGRVRRWTFAPSDLPANT